jgi:xanthine dehydrogenase accessory factor
VTAPTGRVEYRVELEAPPKLLIAGGGHIGKVIAQMAVPLGFGVSVIDDREQFANSIRLPAPITPVVGDIAQTLASSPIDSNTFVVIVTRGHRHDERALAAVLDSPAKYIGMIGSRRKVAVIFRDLQRDGATAEQLERVHAPMGLPINAITVEEIAVSVVAQLIEVRRRNARRQIEGPLPVDEHGD